MNDRLAPLSRVRNTTPRGRWARPAARSRRDWVRQTPGARSVSKVEAAFQLMASWGSPAEHTLHEVAASGS